MSPATPLFNALRPSLQALVKEAINDAIDVTNDMSAEDINYLTPALVKEQAVIMFGINLDPDSPAFYVPSYLIPVISEYVDSKLVFALYK